MRKKAFEDECLWNARESIGKQFTQRLLFYEQKWIREEIMMKFIKLNIYIYIYIYLSEYTFQNTDTHTHTHTHTHIYIYIYILLLWYI